MKKLMTWVYATLIFFSFSLIANGQSITLSTTNVGTSAKFNYQLVDSATAVNLFQLYISLDGPSGTFYKIGTEKMLLGSVNDYDSIASLYPNTDYWIKAVISNNDTIYESNVLKINYIVPLAPWAIIDSIKISGTNSAKIYGRLITYRQNTDLSIITQAGDTLGISFPGDSVDTNFELDWLNITIGHIYNVKALVENATGDFTTVSVPFYIAVTNTKEIENENIKVIVNQNLLILSNLSGDFKIINLGGQTEMSGQIEDEINISSLPKGVYILITNDGFTKKFIKK